MKRYYIVITPFFPTEKDFRGPFIYEQVVELKKLFDGEVVVFKTSQTDELSKDYIYKGIKVHCIKQKKLPSNILPGLFDKKNVKTLIQRLDDLKINIDQIEVLHSHSSGSSIYSNFLKEKNNQIVSIVQLHGLDVLGMKNGVFKNIFFHHYYLEKFYQKKYRSIDYIVGVSELTLNQFNKYKGFENKKKITLYNGVNQNQFFQIKNHKKKLPNHIGCIGNLIDIKDQITLLKAFKILIDKNINSHLTIIGSGINDKYLREYVNENNLNSKVFFISHMKHEDLNQFYNDLDIFVLPSYYEAMGCVYLEAFSCNVPFVAIENQGITELIEDKEKWTIKKSDYKRLSELLENYFNLKPIQNISKEFNIEKTVRNFLTEINII